MGGGYLTHERSDAFVTGLLYYAMIKDRDIVWETPCSEQLIFQMQTYLIPVYAQEMAFMHKIELRGPTTTDNLPCGNGVATGLSNGVDCEYTVQKFLSCEYPEYRLTHVLFTDCFTTAYSEEYRKDFLKNYLEVIPKCAEELGLEFIFVEYHPDIEFSIGIIDDKECGIMVDGGFHPLKYCSIAMALQKLIGKYYFSSGFSPSGFSFHEIDLSHCDIFTLPLISTDALRFYSSGMEVTRVEKAGLLGDWPYAQKHLQTCANRNDTNCGHCYKCIRTMAELYANGKLDYFGDVFPIDDFKSHLTKRLAYLLAKSQSGLVLCTEVIQKIKDEGIHIPTMSYVLSPGYRLADFAHEHLRTKVWARNIYKKLGLKAVIHRHEKFNDPEQMDALLRNKSK